MSAFGAKRTGKKRFVMSASLTHSGSRVPRFTVGAQSRRAPAVLRPAEWGSAHHFAWQQSQGLNVCFGSKADIGARPVNVRFTPKSGHRNSAAECPLCAKSGHPTATHNPMVGHRQSAEGMIWLADYVRLGGWISLSKIHGQRVGWR